VDLALVDGEVKAPENLLLSGPDVKVSDF